MLGYEPRLHDRFYVGPDRAFIGEGHDWSRPGDWSGVGTIVDIFSETITGHWPMTMISEHYFITAYHIRPSRYGDPPGYLPPIRFYREDDPSAEIWEGTLALNAADPTGYVGSQIAPDLWLGRLDEAPPDWVRRYPLMKRNTDTNWITFVDPTVFVFGQGAAPFSYTTGRVGRNEIEHRLHGTKTFNLQSPPGLGADESRTEGYDSGSPMFAISPAGPALFSVSISVDASGSPTMPQFYSEIQSTLPMDEHTTLVTDLLGDIDADYDVDLDDRNILEANPAGLPGKFLDLDRNGVIDVGDLNVLDSQLGKKLRAPSDFTQDNVIDGADFSIIANHWMSTVTQFQDGDATGDSLVNRDDILVFESNRIDSLKGQPVRQIAGDANFDGVVSTADFQLWADNLFRNDVPAPYYSQGDVTGDNVVDLQDLIVLRSNHGKIGSDVNGDGKVTLADIDAILANWEQTVSNGIAGGDLNLDSIVNALDLAGAGEFLGFQYRPPLPKQNVGIVPGDFDGDFDIDGADFLALQRGDDVAASIAEWSALFGAPGAAIVSVPEPSAKGLVLASLTAIAIVSYRRQRRMVK